MIMINMSCMSLPSVQLRNQPSPKMKKVTEIKEGAKGRGKGKSYLR